MTSLGEWLRDEREARDISLEEIAAATKIVSRYLEALEQDRFDLMPGGFFIKAIIRAYAGAIGLSPDEVVAKYRAAGLLGGTEAGPSDVQRAPAVEAPPLPQAFAAEPAVAPDKTERPAGTAAPALAIEEAPRPRISPPARKRVLTTSLGAAGILAIVALVVLIRPSPKRPSAAPSEPETVIAQQALPAAQPAQLGTAPAASLADAEPAGEPSPAGTGAPAAVDEAWKGITIEISFIDETYIRVHTDGTLQVDGLFPAGATATAHADRELLIQTGNAGGFTFSLNGRPAKPLGRVGRFLTDIKITPDNYREFLEVPSSGPPSG